MKMNPRKLYAIFANILVVVPALTCFLCVSDEIPWSFGIDGTPQIYGNKIVLLIPTVLMFVYTIVGFFFHNKSNVHQSFILSPFILTLFLTINSGVLLINFFFLNGGTRLKFGFPLCSLLIVTVATICIFIEKNSFIGTRTKWSFYNTNTWKKTQIGAAKITSIIGIVVAFSTSVASPPFDYFLFAIGFIIDAILCIAYSFLCYKKEANRSNSDTKLL